MRQAGWFGVPQVRSWSWQAFGLAFAIVAVSAIFQGAACIALGTQLYFAAFLPAIFVVGLLAGAPAAVFAILLSIALVWWAFIPPFFEFTPLSRANAESVNLFFLLAVLLIGLADLCRQTIAIINRGDLKPTDKGVAPNSQ